MELVDLIKKEIKYFKKNEIILFFSVIIFVSTVSFYFKDSKIACISAICGISYTFFAGFGKAYCYLIGITGTFCYCYLAYKNGFWGNLCLYAFYYLPMEIIGIFMWQKHSDKDKNEITKTKLNNKQRMIYFLIGLISGLIGYLFLKSTGGKSPFMDSFTTVFSIIGLLLTVKRCIEQWYVWIFVNSISFLMWLSAVLSGAPCVSTLLMWGVYLFLAIYFLKKWSIQVD